MSFGLWDILRGLLSRDERVPVLLEYADQITDERTAHDDDTTDPMADGGHVVGEQPSRVVVIDGTDEVPVWAGPPPRRHKGVRRYPSGLRVVRVWLTHAELRRIQRWGGGEPEGETIRRRLGLPPRPE